MTGRDVTHEALWALAAAVLGGTVGWMVAFRAGSLLWLLLGLAPVLALAGIRAERSQTPARTYSSSLAFGLAFALLTWPPLFFLVSITLGSSVAAD